MSAGRGRFAPGEAMAVDGALVPAYGLMEEQAVPAGAPQRRTRPDGLLGPIAVGGITWVRVPNPGRTSGGNRWHATARGAAYVIAKARGRFYLTGAFGFMAPQQSLGVFGSLTDAKAHAEGSL